MIDIKVIEEIENEELPFYKKLIVILQAINDWDDNIDNIEEYLQSVKIFLGGSISMNRIEINQILIEKNSLKKLWKMESISVLLDILDNDCQILEDVLKELSTDIKKYISHR